MQRFRGGLVFKAHRLCVSLNSRLESNKEKRRIVAAPPQDIRLTFADSLVIFRVFSRSRAVLEPINLCKVPKVVALNADLKVVTMKASDWKVVVLVCRVAK